MTVLSGKPASDSPSRARPTAAMSASHTLWKARYCEIRLPNMPFSFIFSFWFWNAALRRARRDYFFAAFLAICARCRSSCSRSSGVNSGPKSSASKTWRISTSVSSKGARLSHSIASSFDLTCHSQNPATSSFVSLKGPSITVRFPLENLTRAPFELAWSPSPASITPAFTSSSLNFPMSVRIFLSGRTPASEFLSALTSTMNRIAMSPSTYTTNNGRPDRHPSASLLEVSAKCRGCFDLCLGPSQGDEVLQARLAEVEAEPEEDSERDLDEERIADPPVRADRSPDVSGQKDRTQDRRGRNQIDHGARD